MSKTRTQCALLAASLLLAVTAALPASAQLATAAITPATPPDSNLFTTYSFNNTYTSAYLSVCGSTQGSEGCYGGGSIGPFGRAGALIEGNESVDVATGTVTRYIYVVDEAVNNGTGVTLYVYKKTDVVTSTFDTVNISLANTVVLPLKGGVSAKTYMAADNDFLFIGTDQSSFAVRVQKSNLAINQVGGFSPPINVSAITSDKYGFVTVTFGGISGSDGFYTFGPNGSMVEDGGGADFMVGNSTGLSTANLATTSATPTVRMHVRFKNPALQNTASH
ncbi:hypothetical protein [Dyella silvatica]|uniref:hypothetical protein n=1 Tax=Dyella silvatica TaxID=2992128 RepID=UPI00225608B6|nr:hypothetical protein [Dyella silvatica]